MRSRTPPDLPGRCARCYVLSAWCICADVVPVATRVRIVVARHVRESFKSTNTARIAALALPSLEIRTWGDPDRRFTIDDIDLKSACMLYPGSSAGWPAPPPRVLVIPDGNWNQAKGIARRLRTRWRLPEVGLTPPASDGPRLRAPAHEGRMSTIDAIALALAMLGEQDGARRLARLSRLMTERTLLARGRKDLAGNGGEIDELT